LSEADRSDMLQTIGAATIDELFRDVPTEALLKGPIEGLPAHASELSVERQLTTLARKNLSAGEAPFFLGCGAYKHHIPASVDHIIQRGPGRAPLRLRSCERVDVRRIDRDVGSDRHEPSHHAA
jgi:glycine dehydrogenase subunit 1